MRFGISIETEQERKLRDVGKGGNIPARGAGNIRARTTGRTAIGVVRRRGLRRAHRESAGVSVRSVRAGCGRRANRRLMMAMVRGLIPVTVPFSRNARRQAQQMEIL